MKNPLNIASTPYVDCMVVTVSGHLQNEIDAVVVSGTTIQDIYISDTKSTGASGGNFPANSTEYRDLTTIDFDDTGVVSIQSFSNGNSFTIPAGTYNILATMPFSVSEDGKCWLWNQTVGSIVLMGNTWQTSGQTGIIMGKFTISQSSEMAIGAYKTGSTVSDGYGQAANIGSHPEVYTQIHLQKLA